MSYVVNTSLEIAAIGIIMIFNVKERMLRLTRIIRTQLGQAGTVLVTSRS